MNLQAIASCLIVASAAAAVNADDPKNGERPITHATTVFAIYTEHHGLSSDKLATNRLIFAAWPDGRVVFSQNPTQGGAPYRSGQIDPQRLEAALAIVKHDGLFDNELLTRPQFGPDSQTTIIQLNTPPDHFKLQSWHELYEANGKVVATERGLGSLAQKSRLEVLGQASREYLVYRLAWTELRLAAAQLVPTESRPINGQLQFRDGKALWREQ